MPAYQSQLIFNCTPAQFPVAKTTLAGAGFTLVPVNNYIGIMKAGSFVSNGTTTADSNQLTAVTNIGGFYVGMSISGAGIPAGTTVTAIDVAGDSLTMSANATAAATVPVTGASATGQIDYSYDGQYFLRFFGSNVAPVAVEEVPGVPTNQMSQQLIQQLTNIFAATLGAPVPPNLAVPPTFVP